MAGQPKSRMHFWQPTHLSFATWQAVKVGVTATQGDSKSTQLTPFCAAARWTAATAALKSRGLTWLTEVTPMASSTPRMLILPAWPPIMVSPVPGWGWWPVMAVVELSSTMRIKSVWL